MRPPVRRSCRDCPEVEVFVAGLGTSGTLMGAGRYLKQHKPSVRVVAVEPPAGELVQGLRNLDDGFVPPIFDPALLDRKMIVRPRESVEWTRRLLNECGVFAGISSGAAMAGAAKTAEQMDRGTIVVLLPDGGWKYLSSGAWTDPIDEVVERAIAYQLLVARLSGPEEIERAAQTLRAGDLVAFPTETVYGLGADASNRDAVKRLYAVKHRPPDHPVIVHVASAAHLEEFAGELPDAARRLADALWPGPLTLVVMRNAARVVPEVTGGRDTVGLRVPDHPVALALLAAFGGGVAAPSANRFGKVSPTTAAHVRADLGRDVNFVLDGGPCRVGIESTIVDVTGPEPAILRVGEVSRARIEGIIGTRCAVRTTGAIAAPGTLASHYAPRAAVEIVDATAVVGRAHELLAGDRRVGLLAVEPPEAGPVSLAILDPPRDVVEYGRVLYSRLRAADDLDLDVLLVVLPPETDGLGAAVADRVRRAAG